MRTFFTVMLILFSSYLNAQDFMGIEPSGHIKVVSSKMISKGLKLEDSVAGVGHIFTGTVNMEDISVMVLYTPITRQVWKIAVFMEEKSTWADLKRDYLYIKKILSDKYGNPEKDYHFFADPYDEGDGYELQAVKLEKAHYQAFWKEKLWITIAKGNNVIIHYENPANSQLAKREKAFLDKSVFYP